ncbi:hypothetical protein ACQKND_12140 [Viridibacillus arvi]
MSIGSMVIFRRPPYLENLQGIEAYILNMYTVSEHCEAVAWLTLAD